MQFIYPGFLWALLAVSVPIIIHLFHFKRFKKVFFTNVRLLKEIKEETSNRNKLKNLLVLLARCLAIVSLVLAFAQPFLPSGSEISSGISNISIFIDNSYSMTAQKNEIPLIDIAKETARDIINAYGEENRFQILTHDFEGRHQRLLSKEDALALISDIKTTTNVKTMSRVINRQLQLLGETQNNKKVYLISDFQKSTSDLSAIKDTTLEINMIPIQCNATKNIAIDSVWFEGPIPFINQNNKLLVRVTNNSGEEAEDVKLNFVKDNIEKPIGIRNIPARGTITDTVIIVLNKSGWHHAIVQVQDYPLQFDDKYYLAFNVPDTIKALSINQGAPNTYLTALFNGVPSFYIQNQNVQQIQFQKFPTYDLIILNDLQSISSGLVNELKKYMDAGGKVLLFPNKNADVNSYNTFFSSVNAPTFNPGQSMTQEVFSINKEQFIFSEVYINTSQNLKLPKTTYSYTLNSNMSGREERLLSYRNGSPYLIKNRVGEGQLFVCNAPLDKEYNDLVFNAEVFVPMVYKMAISTIKQKQLDYKISNNLTVEIDNFKRAENELFKVKNMNSEFIPGQIPFGNKLKMNFGDQITSDGIYELYLGDDLKGLFAFNHDRLESDMTIHTKSELDQFTKGAVRFKLIDETLQANLDATITQKDKGKILWKYMLILALIFLLLEILLIRFYKPS